MHMYSNIVTFTSDIRAANQASTVKVTGYCRQIEHDNAVRLSELAIYKLEAMCVV